MTQDGLDFTRLHFKWEDDGVSEFLHNPVLVAALRDMAEQGAEYARSIAPVVTGRYRENIGVEAHSNASRASYRVVAKDQKSHWIEYGNVHLKPQRILGRAVDRMRGS